MTKENSETPKQVEIPEELKRMRDKLVAGLIAAGADPENRKRAFEWAKDMRKISAEELNTLY